MTAQTSASRHRQPGRVLRAARTAVLVFATAACVVVAQPGTSLAAAPTGHTVTPSNPQSRFLRTADEAVSRHLLDAGVLH